MFDDTKLFKSDKSVDFEYALKWFLSIKDAYDLADFFNDMKDIENLLNAFPEDSLAIEHKREELNNKYSLQVGAVNLFNGSHYNSSDNKLSAEEQLKMFKGWLPIFALAKAGASKILQKYT